MEDNNHIEIDSKKVDAPVDVENRQDDADYGANNITVLAGVEAVRQTPAMYIGDTGSYGLHHLVYEIVDNSIDEALAGYCTHVTVKIHVDESISVVDNGRGIPVDYHEKEQKSALEVITTTLHAGGKFDRSNYKVSGGLHGVGISVVNALTEKMEVEVFCKDGCVYFQNYGRGIPLSPVKKLGKTSKRGTKIWFKPDPEIFEITTYSYGILSKRLRELSFLNRGIHITLVDERDGKKEVFYNEEGIEAFVAHLNQNRNVLHREVIYVQREIEDENCGTVFVELAMQYHDGYNETSYSYANNIHTREGGTHLSGVKGALTRTLNSYAKKENLFKDKFIPIGDDWREGLTFVICVKLPKPQFEGQTKAKLGNREIQGIVETALNEQLAIYLEEHPPVSKAIVNKGINAARVRQATKKVRDLERQRKSPLHSGGLPGKLADCSNRGIETTELYLVEGDSAGGSAKSGRDRRFQAILPLKGKILNVEKARLDKILSHNEIKMIVAALGAGIQNDFDIKKRRYGKIIIMTDADVDGSHIRTLLLTFFYRNMRSLVEEGCLYIAQPPLYKFKRKKKEQYIYSDRDFENALMEFGSEATTLKMRSKNLSFAGEDLKTLLHAISNLGHQLGLLEKKGMDGQKFLKIRKNGSFPVYKYIFHDQSGYFFSEEELNAFEQEQYEKLGEELNLVDMDDTNGEQNTLRILEIRNSGEICKCVDIIEKFGLDPESYFTSGKEEYDLHNGNDVITLSQMSEMMVEVKNMGRKGLDVQRYKGLGEMNPDQLWVTTMNPETRTLFKVALEDASEADLLFSTLMGSNVEPRREFIEKHALDVRNLDV